MPISPLRAGFSLLELLFSLAIFTLLLALALPGLGQWQAAFDAATAIGQNGYRHQIDHLVGGILNRESWRVMSQPRLEKITAATQLTAVSR